MDTTKYKVKSPIGSISAYKMIIISKRYVKTGDEKLDNQMEKEVNKNSLRFIDIRNFVAGGSLHDFVMNFG